MFTISENAVARAETRGAHRSLGPYPRASNFFPVYRNVLSAPVRDCPIEIYVYARVSVLSVVEIWGRFMCMYRKFPKASTVLSVVEILASTVRWTKVVSTE